MNKKKTGYSVWSNIAYAIGACWQERKALIVLAAIGVLMRVALPFTGILMPKLVIDALQAQVTVTQFVVTVGGAGLLLVALNFFKSYTDIKIDSDFGLFGVGTYSRIITQKRVTMDYELMEDPEAQKLHDKAMKAANNNSQACNLLRFAAMLMVNVFGFILYGSVITAIHPVIVLLLAVSAVINWFVLSYSRKYEISTCDERSKTDRRLKYTIDSLSNRELAKDIRMYTMTGWLKGLLTMLMAEKHTAEGKVASRVMLTQLIDGLMILVRDGAAYAFLVYMLVQGQIALGDFVFIFAAIGSFAGWISGIILQASEMLQASSGLSDFRAYLDMPDRSNTGSGTALPPLDKAPGIRLENVTYGYQGAEHPTLENINVDIRPGERIAVVGANGAGKTTLIKLICGLYRPKSGSVQLAGTDISEFNRDDYFSTISAVFQDIHLLATTIAGNVSQQSPEHTDRTRVEQCLKLAGLYDKVQSLPDGLDTLLVRRVNEEAIELSGGEQQKLALARALYKDAPVIILDEPTAALDPIAENEVYQQYADLTQGKTSVYISHRLASTRFCDRILFVDDHRIAEEGTHDELIQLGGKYAEMFAIQASYYADNKEGAA